MTLDQTRKLDELVGTIEGILTDLEEVVNTLEDLKND